MKKDCSRWTRSLAVAAGLALLSVPAFCDEPFSMAPPIQQYYDSQAYDNGTPSVFNWSEVPQNQQIPIRRAVFDQGGYQLYDNAGETIVVPFTNHNLYAMKFGRSDNGTMYFVNDDGNVPVLYVPHNGSLENAAVPGARWYPFSEDFHPSHPVFLGIAPSWDDFYNMGWYPNMYCHGGYYSERTFVSGAIFLPTFGLFVQIGGHHYDDWDRYHDYCDYHPAPYRVTVVNNYIYERPYHQDWSGQPFQGTGHPYFGGRSNDTGRPSGSGRPFGASQSYGSNGSDHSGYAHRTTSDNARVFRGAAPESGRGSYSAPSYSNGRHYDASGNRPTEGSSGRPFQGGQPAIGSGRSYEPIRPAGNSRSYGNGRVFNSGSPAPAEGNRSYSSHADSGNGNSSGRSYHPSDTRASNEGSHSQSGGSNGSGDHSQGGGFNGSSYRSR